MYVAKALAYAGFALLLGGVATLAILPLVLLVINPHVIAREGRYLTIRFGEAYAAFRGRVRRWLQDWP